MSVLLVHDHRIINYDCQMYSNGSFTDEVFYRYTNVFETITFYSRNISLNELNGNFSRISNKKVQFIGVKSFSSLINNKMRNELYNQIRKADALIIRLPSVLGILSTKIAKRNKIPYLIELVGCPWDAFWNHSSKGKLIAPFMWHATKKAVKKAPYVLYVTNNFLQHRYPTNGKNIGCSDVVLPSLDQKVLEVRLHKIKQMGSNKPIILGTTAAIDVRYKGQEFVIQALSELNKQGYNFEYHLVGGGDKSRLQSIANKYGVANKVIFEGSVPHEKVFNYLDNIDIYIQPSKIEGLPRALIEAMSRGCPCIGTNAGGMPELLDEDFTVKNGNISSLVNILSTIDCEKLSKQAARNFEFTRNFTEDILDAERNRFMQEFKEYISSPKSGLFK